MFLLNFSHPLTSEHLAQVEALTGQEVERVIDRPAEFDAAKPFAPQVVALVDSVALNPAEWQTLPLIVNPPSLNLIAVSLLAELHGRMGYFPPVLRLRSAAEIVPPRFDVAEIISLQDLRQRARKRR